MAHKLGVAKWGIFTTTRFSSGAAYDATGTPTGVAYKNGIADALTVTIAKIETTTGIYSWTCTPTTGAGFAAGNSISVVINALVDGVEMVGCVWDDVLTTADIDSTLAANVTQWNGSNVATPNVAGYPVIDCAKWLGQTIAAVDTNGYPKTTIKTGTGAGELNVSGGKAPATIAAGDLATDSITAAALNADAVAEIISAIATATHDGITYDTIMTALYAFLAGEKVISEGDGYTDIEYFKQNGTSGAFKNRLTDSGSTPQIPTP